MVLSTTVYLLCRTHTHRSRVSTVTDEWASGEESSRESRVKVQRPQEWMLVARQGKKYNRNSRSESRHRRFALVPRKTFPKKGNSWTQYPSRKKRTLSGIKSNDRWNKFSHKDRDQSIQRSGSAISRHGRQGYGLQEQRAILQTSDNVTATLILSESPCTMSSMSAAPTHQQGSIAPHQGQPGFVVSPLSSRLESRPCQDTVTYPTEHLAESFRTRTVVDGPNTLVRDPKAQLRSAHNWPGRQQASDRKVACPAPNDSERTPESPSAREAVSSNFTDILKTRIDQASPNTGKGYLKRKPPKSKSNASGTPKRFMSSAVTLPHRKIYHRKGPVTSRSQGRQLNIQWNESSPTSAAPTAGSSYSRPVFPDMVEECTTHEVANSLHVYDGASSQQGMSNNVDLQPSEQFPKVEDGIEPPGVDNSNSALVQITQPHPVPAEPQSCSGAEPQENYPPASQHGLVPTSLAMASTGGVGGSGGMDTSPSPLPAAGTSQASNMSSVYWSCLSDEPSEMVPTEPGGFAVNAGGAIPVASDMDFLTAEDMTRNGVNIGSQKLRLAHGYDVFISRLDLWEAEKASKKGWTILIRRLLDIYFDRMTLAMGKPTHHGNSMEYQPLDQNIIGAISAFIKARYNIEKRKLIQAISIYCSDCRKSGIPGSMIENPKAMYFPDMQ